MSDVKWIKIEIDIFNNRKIKQIRKLPDGDGVIGIWLQILCLAGTVNDCGTIYLTRDVPYTDQMLSVEFDRPISIIKMALDVFRQFGMISIVNDFIQVSNWEKYQNIDGMDKIREQGRARIARYRERQLASIASIPCQYCGGESTGYDHVIALAVGGSDSIDNKVACCLDCNKIKNNRPLVDFLNNNRDRINDSIVTQNMTLSKYVILNNVTDRYEVTQCNETEKIRVEKSREDKSRIDNADKPRRFSKPTVEEVAEYCRERGNRINAQSFVDFYESKGWKVGSSPMKDWKSCVRTWEQRDKEKNPPKKEVSNADRYAITEGFKTSF